MDKFLSVSIKCKEPQVLQVSAYNRVIPFTIDNGTVSFEDKDFAVFNCSYETVAEWLVEALFANGFISKENPSEVDPIALKKCYKYLSDCKLITDFVAKLPGEAVVDDVKEVKITIVNKVFLRKQKILKVLHEHIKLVVNSSEKELKENPYILMDENGNQYLTNTKATYGGNSRGDRFGNSIYGQLTCKSANDAIELGYIRYRVFFKDEATAIAAGYRPCGTCCREKYVLWKEKNSK